MTFGEKLQALRRRTGMSQDMLAEKLEVSRQAVSKWERDEAMPETDKLVRIAKLFDISLDELLMGKKPQPEQTQTAQPGQVYTDVKRTVKRHGYKLGYVFLTLGVLTCVLSLLMYFLWPGLAGSFFGGFDNVFSPAGQTEMIFDFGDLPDSVRGEMEAALREELNGMSGYSMMDPAISQMKGMRDSALKTQASLFLIGLVPGLLLTATGAVILIKGKKLAEETA